MHQDEFLWKLEVAKPIPFGGHIKVEVRQNIGRIYKLTKWLYEHRREIDYAAESIEEYKRTKPKIWITFTIILVAILLFFLGKNELRALAGMVVLYRISMLYEYRSAYNPSAEILVSDAEDRKTELREITDDLYKRDVFLFVSPDFGEAELFYGRSWDRFLPDE
ncbi:MAG: hypothetical protein H3C28_11675 [Sphingomonadales bacterium]|nr:hypothetical protein [Sphingomonadales bacterium]